MRPPSHTLQYIFAGVLVVILGGFAGWYVFVNRHITTTEAIDAARGLGLAPSFSAGGNTFTGTGIAGIAGNTSQGGSGGVIGSGSVAPRLWQVTSSPVAGLGFAASSTRIYFLERSSGNVLSADPALAKTTRLTNTLFPKTYEALFSADGSVVLRSISDTGTIVSYAAKIATSSNDAGAAGTLAGVYLPTSIAAIAARQASQQLFWLLPEGRSGVTGITSNWRGGTQKKVVSSALKGWRAQWLSDGKIYLVQNPTDNIPGYAFRIGANGALEEIVGNIPGLTVLPKSGSSALLYGSSLGGKLSLYAITSASSTPLLLPVHTIAEKCVWAPGSGFIAYCAVPQAAPASNFLRNWYEGATHTADAWWKVNTSAGTAEILFRPDSSTELDAENPTIDESGSYLAFMNTLDKSLWMLRINQ